MKKMICTVLAIAMLAAPVTMAVGAEGYTQSSETDKEALKESFLLVLDRSQTVDDWREELAEWFNFYYDRVENGEELTENEMNLVFAYARISAELIRMWNLEAIVNLGGEGSSDSLDNLVKMVETLNGYWEMGVLEQKEVMDSLNGIFAPAQE